MQDLESHTTVHVHRGLLLLELHSAVAQFIWLQFKTADDLQPGVSLRPVILLLINHSPMLLWSEADCWAPLNKVSVNVIDNSSATHKESR